MDDELQLKNPSTRAEAMGMIRAFLEGATAQGRRLLLGFDFAFGYPRAFSQALKPGGDWRDVWARIASLVQDGPKNATNRFHAAAKLNEHFEAEGPFWGNGLKEEIEGLPRKKPSGWGESLPANARHAETLATSAQEVWKLSGIGSVGSQALTGIAALEGLRAGRAVDIWPFETLGEGARHVLAEVYPSLLPLLAQDMIKDAAQVEALARAFARCDAQGVLAEMLNAPGQQHADIRTDEAAILGLSHLEDLRAAAPEVLRAAPQSTAQQKGSRYAPL